MVAGPEQEGHYRLLGTVRAYAAEQLTAHGEDRWVTAAHARHLVAVAERADAGMCGPDEPQWIERITSRLEELRVVFRWARDHDAGLAVRLAAALARYARYQMRFEMQDWAAVAADLPGAAEHPCRPIALASAAGGAWARGDFARAGELAGRALALLPEDDPRRAWPELVVGDIALLEGRFADAGASYAWVDRWCGSTNPHVRCEALGGLALVAAYQGDPQAAAEAAEACLRVGRAGPVGAAALAAYFAGESKLTSDPDRALELLEEARRLAEGINALLVVGFATVSLVSERARRAADPVDGLVAYREAVEHWRRVGNRAQQWVTLRNLVPELVRAGQDELACVVYAAVTAAPVNVPDGMPEAETLAAAVGQARERLPDRGAAALQRGAQAALEDLLPQVLAVIDEAAVRPRRAGRTATGRSRSGAPGR